MQQNRERCARFAIRLVTRDILKKEKKTEKEKRKKRSHEKKLARLENRTRFERGIFIRGDWFPRVPRLRPSTGFSLVTGRPSAVPGPSTHLFIGHFPFFHILVPPSQSPMILDADTRRILVYSDLSDFFLFQEKTAEGKGKVGRWPRSNFPSAIIFLLFFFSSLSRNEETSSRGGSFTKGSRCLVKIE